MAPIEPPPSPWILPDPSGGPSFNPITVGADLEAGTLLSAYRSGLFPMPVTRRKVGWWSPDPRGILPLGSLKVSRSLRKSCTRFEIRIDTAFETVIDSCADPARPHGWIDGRIRDAYCRLHELGWAHSVEAWNEDGQLAGGLYGVAIGGLFAGESMFHRETDASKVALVGLVEVLKTGPAASEGVALLDVQWSTEHLESLGTIEIPRDLYLARLALAIEAPLPSAFA